MAASWVLGADWASLEAALARRLDLAGTAAAAGALVRRRGIGSAAALLRLALVYGGTDLSLRGTALWARAAGVADLSDVALMYRLQRAEGWLAGLFEALLSQEIGTLGVPGAVPGGILPGGPLQGRTLPAAGAWRLRLVDGTSLPGGGGGPGYHLHACFDVGAQRFDDLVLTTPRDAESLARHGTAPGEIMIADRGFAKAAGVRAAAAQGGHLIVRRGLTACRLRDARGRPLAAQDILALARDGTQADAIVDLPVQLPATDDAPALALRLIIEKKPAAAAARSRRRAEKKAQRQGYAAKPKQLEAEHYVMLMTTLDAATMPAAQVLALYRLRWQIELAFKRLKSLGGLDTLQAKEERLAKAAIWAKLILAILAESLLGHVLALSPSPQNLHLAPLPGPAPAP